jgi:hypothetical protein
MATTTFSGPIKAGTISNTTGTTVGTNIANTGQVVMTQSLCNLLRRSNLQQQVQERCNPCKQSNH